MKIISLWQPYASAIALGLKRIETRSWSTPYTGPIAIHAAKKWDAETRGILTYLPAVASRALKLDLCRPMRDGAFPLGSIVAVADLVGCYSTTLWPDRQARMREYLFIKHPTLDTPLERALGNYDPRRYGWVLANVRRLTTPIPYRGSQGLRDLDPRIERQLVGLAA